MTPQEKQQVDELFDRLSQLESSNRDPQAMSAIAEGLRRAPNALYALVQTVLVQDEALKQFEARIRELEEAAGGAPRPAQGGFLDSMRETIFGREAPRGSVPSVRPGAPNGAWNNGAQSGAPVYGQRMNEAGEAQQRPGFGGGSFLGTAAAAAAGVIGGSLLMNSLSSMMGSRGNAQSLSDNSGGGESKSPWASENNSGNASGDLSRDAGLNDVGHSPRQSFSGEDSNKASNDSNGDSGAFDTAGFDDSSDGFDSFDLGDSDFG